MSSYTFAPQSFKDFFLTKNFEGSNDNKAGISNVHFSIIRMYTSSSI